LSCLRVSSRLFFLLLPPPPTPTLFPYTTLFRSIPIPARVDRATILRSEGRKRACSLPFHSLLRTGRFTWMYRWQLCGQRWISCPDRKSTRLNSSHRTISYAVFCLKKKKHKIPDK